jgi:hypothetical protein
MTSFHPSSFIPHPFPTVFAPLAQQGSLGKAHQRFGAGLHKLLDELNTALSA